MQNGDAAQYQTELLLVLPVCLGQGPDGLMFELQAAYGIMRWLENFSSIKVICPLVKAEDLHRWHSTVWKPVSEIEHADRVEFIPLPYAPSMGAFTRAYKRARATIRKAIGESRYLSFAIGGLFGDWGAIACLEAQSMERAYSVWTDRVEHKVNLVAWASLGRLMRLKAKLRSRLMYALERRCITRSTLGLFHGGSCFNEYSPWCRTSYLVQDFPLPEDPGIGAQLVKEFSKGASHSDATLTIAYVGRADEMKGPLDWVKVMEQLYRRGVPFKATWLGDGPHLAEMRERVAQCGLENVVLLPGFVESRLEVFRLLHQAHVFVFCHKSPESPRNLVEALVSGCPVVGYESGYASEITKDGGGVLVPVGDIAALTDQLCALDSDRARLAALKAQAVPAGERVQRLADFRYRSDLIKAHL